MPRATTKNNKLAGQKLYFIRDKMDSCKFIDMHELNVSQPTISRWESGKTTIPLDVLIKLGIVEFVKLSCI